MPTRNKKLLVAPGTTTRKKKLLVTRCIATRAANEGMALKNSTSHWCFREVWCLVSRAPQPGKHE